MSLRPAATEIIPEETARIAHAAFPKGSPAMPIRDELACIYDDRQFVDLYATCG